MSVIHLTFETKTILFSELSNMVCIPEFQRIMDEDHITEIYKYNEQQYLSSSNFHIFGNISLGFVNDKYFVLDGQHRICAYFLLFQNYCDFDISVNVYTRNTMEELQDVYYRINKNKPVPLITDSYVEENIINGCLKMVQRKFQAYLKKTKKPQSPNINLEGLQRALIESNILKTCAIKSAEQLFQLICELNYFFCSMPCHQLIQKQAEWGIVIKFEKMSETDKMLLLGYYTKFEWIGFIIKHLRDEIPYESMVMCSVKNYAKIPRGRREELLRFHFQSNMDGQCYVCQKEIHFTSFEAGHIEPRAYGGTNDLSNLRPICKACNRDMGTQNLEKYKLQYA